ncbi:Oxo-4-hydroxy-4-carboxy-5-ureidoimidazoline decarboxylase, partial [Geopyxis carbonaria]
MAYKLPPLAALSSSPEHIAPALDALFEPSPALHTLVAARLLPVAADTYDSYNSFIDAVAELLLQLRGKDDEKLLAVLAAHPRLGAKKVDSAQSEQEQRSLQEGAAEEAEALKGLNETYEEKFPGMRYVVFVNGRSRSVVMEDMKARISRGDIEAEKTAAIEAMRDIAKDRAAKLGTS